MEKRLIGLDALRGVAALIVVFMHSSDNLQGGHLAVDFFLMLSGYVMARTYEDRLRQGVLQPAQFMKLRLRRLWPTMAVGALLGFAVAVLASGWSLSLATVLIFALLLVPGSATTPYVLNLPAWSIFYELIANAVHAKILVRTSLRILGWVIALAALGLVICLFTIGFPRILSTTSIDMQILVILRLALSYTIGICLFRCFRDRSPIKLHFAAGVIALPVYVAIVAVNPFFGWQLVFVLIVGPLMLLAGLGDHADSAIWPVLGQLSFPLYAVHMPVMQMMRYLGMTDGMLSIAASVLVASVWLIPWQRWLAASYRVAAGMHLSSSRN